VDAGSIIGAGPIAGRALDGVIAWLPHTGSLLTVGVRLAGIAEVLRLSAGRGRFRSVLPRRGSFWLELVAQCAQPGERSTQAGHR
jgi:hypothetical protein